MSVNITAKGAKGDVKRASGIAIAIKSRHLTITVDLFIPDDAKTHKTIGIEKGEIGGLPLNTVIEEFLSSKEVILEKAPLDIKLPAVDVTWGTNDTVKIQKAIDEAGPGETIEFPAGMYCAHDLSLRSDISLVSSNRDATLTQLIGDESSYFFKDLKEIGPLNNVTFQGLIFDGNRDHNSKNCDLLALGNANSHSHFRFLDCEIRNFGHGINVKGINHSSFEISRCKFSNMGSAVGFNNSSTTGIIISECEFFDLLRGIEIFPDFVSGTPNICDQVLIERCYFHGSITGYPIHFGGGPSGKTDVRKDATYVTSKRDFRFAATHVTVKGSIIRGPGRWFWRDGSADQIALYGVKHFSVTGNVSIHGGDGGIVIENCQYGTISGNSCEENFSPGIIIDAGSFININGNVCINNCRRTPIIVTDDDKKKHPGITQGYVPISIAPAGIGLGGNEILVNNNLCMDDSYPNTETQTYGLAESSLCKNVAVGSNFFIDNVPSSEARDIFYQDGSTREAFNTYPEYLAKGHFISSSVSYNPTSEALAAAGYQVKATPAGNSERRELPYINVAGNDKMGTIILNVPDGSIGMEVDKPILKITFTKKYASDISHIIIIPHGTDTKTLVAEPTDVTRDSFGIKLTTKATSPGKIYVWDYEVIT